MVVNEQLRQKRILFVCIHNSARSQMAEAFLKRECMTDCIIESAGLEAGVMNPIVIEAMKEKGIDLSQKSSQSVDQVIASGKQFTHVITVCDDAAAEQCPFIPGMLSREHWSLLDPSGFVGTKDERLERTREVRDDIEKRVMKWCEVNCVTATT